MTSRERMKTSRIEEFFSRLIKAGFDLSTVRFSNSENEGLRRTIGLLLKHRALLVILIVTGLGAALFEGGTIGILGLAVSVIVSKDDLGVGGAFDWSGEVVEVFLQSRSRENLFLLLVGLAVVAQIIKSSLLYASQVSQVYLSTAMRREMQKSVTEHVMAMSYSQVSLYPPGVTATIIDQSQCVQDMVDLVSNVSRSTLMIAAYFAVLWWMSTGMLLATFGVLVVFWFILGIVVRKIKDLSVKATAAKIFVWRWTIEYLNAPRLLRIFNGTEFARDAINNARDSELIPERNSTVIEAAIKPAIEVVTIFGAGVFLIMGYVLAGENAVSAIPKLFVFVLVFLRMRPQIQAFNDLRIKLAKLLPPLVVVTEFLQKEGKTFLRIDGIPLLALRNEIHFSDVSFGYSDSELVLRDINFSIPRGATVAIVGASGGGKSTIVDLVLGLYEPTGGDIIVDGRSLSEINLFDWREKIGVVDQEVFLLNTTVEENICFSRPNIDRENLEQAARGAYAHEFIEKLEQGYETVIGNRGYRLSGGQQQRLALARALLRNPEILVLDEATSSLDTISERLIQRAIEKMHNERTILVIAHRLSTIINADQIIVLDHGQIVERGTKAELLKKGGDFARLWDIQIDSGQ